MVAPCLLVETARWVSAHAYTAHCARYDLHTTAGDSDESSHVSSGVLTVGIMGYMHVQGCGAQPGGRLPSDQMVISCSESV